MNSREKLKAAGADDLLTRFIATVDGKRQVVANVDDNGNVNLTEAGKKFLDEPTEAASRPSRKKANPAAGDLDGLE